MIKIESHCLPMPTTEEAAMSCAEYKGAADQKKFTPLKSRYFGRGRYVKCPTIQP